VFEPDRPGRWAYTRAMIGTVISWVLGLGTIVLVLIILGVRPGNFAEWLVSPVGLIVIVIVVVIAVWAIRRIRRGSGL
jgi:uncharacterized membrane protein